MPHYMVQYRKKSRGARHDFYVKADDVAEARTKFRNYMDSVNNPNWTIVTVWLAVWDIAYDPTKGDE